MSFELFFMSACTVFVVLCVGWGCTIGRLGLRALPGAAGSLLSALVMGAIWNADRFDWVGLALKPILAVWLGSMVLCGIAIAVGSEKEGGTRAVSLALGVTGLLAHAVMVVVFLWMATLGV
jgi:hypothetical protein